MEKRNATYGHIGNSQGHIHKTVTKFQVAKETSPQQDWILRHGEENHFT